MRTVMKALLPCNLLFWCLILTVMTADAAEVSSSLRCHHQLYMYFSTNCRYLPLTSEQCWSTSSGIFSHMIHLIVSWILNVGLVLLDGLAMIMVSQSGAWASYLNVWTLWFHTKSSSRAGFTAIHPSILPWKLLSSPDRQSFSHTLIARGYKAGHGNPNLETVFFGSCEVGVGALFHHWFHYIQERLNWTGILGNWRAGLSLGLGIVIMFLDYVLKVIFGLATTLYDADLQ